MTIRHNHLYGNRKRFEGLIWVLIPFLLVFGVALASPLISASQTETKTCTVTDKDRTKGSNNQSDMRIYTEQCGTLAVTDVWWKGQFNSADIYSSIKVGKTYRFETVGFRIPLFSSFKKITEVDPA